MITFLSPAHARLIYALSGTVLALSLVLLVSLVSGGPVRVAHHTSIFDTQSASLTNKDNGSVNTSVFIPSMPAEVSVQISE